MELTKEHFDEYLEQRLTLHFKLFEKVMDLKLQALEERSKQFTMQAFETHQTWTTEHFKEWMAPYEIRLSRVEVKLEELSAVIASSPGRLT